jgi:hypothetical protein
MLAQGTLIPLFEIFTIKERNFIVHGRAGSVALPRVKVTPASPAFVAVAELAVLRTVRAAGARKRAVVIVV